MKHSIQAWRKRLCMALTGVVILGGTSPAAYAEIEGNITLASNYIWRGLDRNNTNPALQGGFDLNLQNGLYAGVWGSNVSVEGEQTTNNIEMDLYAGYTRSFKDFGLDFAFIRYEYPKATPDFEELMLQANYKGLSLAYYFNISDPDVGESESYVRLKADINLPGAVGMTLSAGQSDLKNQENINDGFLGFTKYAGGVKLGLSGTTSNYDHVTNTDVDTEFITVSVSKAL